MLHTSGMSSLESLGTTRREVAAKNMVSFHDFSEAHKSIPSGSVNLDRFIPMFLAPPVSKDIDLIVSVQVTEELATR